MFFIILMFLSALSIASVSAFFSITGLAAIFAGSKISIIIMGSVLEIGKLVLVSYIYRYRKLFKGKIVYLIYYFPLVLMLITSMGIFGYLSRAHLATVGPQDTYKLQIKQIDQQISMYNNKIQSDQKVLTQLDSAIQKYIKMGYITRGLKKRQAQKEQRTLLNNDIDRLQNKISTLNNKKFGYKQKIESINHDIGPIKYVAQILFGNSKSDIDKAVKILTIILVSTFDPLAVVLLICANHAYANRSNKNVENEFSVFKKDKNEDPQDPTNDEDSQDLSEELTENDDKENIEESEDNGILYYKDLSEEDQKFYVEKVKNFLESKELDMDELNNDSEDGNIETEESDPSHAITKSSKILRNTTWLPHNNKDKE